MITKGGFIILVSLVMFSVAANAQNHTTGEKKKAPLEKQSPVIFQVVDHLALFATKYLTESNVAKKADPSSFSSNMRFSAVYQEGLGGIGLAVSNNYINEKFLMGVELEFQANPVSGSGLILFKKSF